MRESNNVGKLTRALQRERVLWREARAVSGARSATVQRLQAFLEIDTQRATLEGARKEIAVLQRELAQLQTEHANFAAHLAAGAQTWGHAAARAELSLAIEATNTVVRETTLTNPPLLSVITPTHNRRSLLERAVASIRGQSYDHWELVIALDRCTDDTLEYVTKMAADDARIRWVVADAGAAGPTRNVALAAATGDVVVYLDDDNQFHPDWLRSVAWAFATYPDVQVLYGVLLQDHADRNTELKAPSMLPYLVQLPFDRAVLAENNITDMGAIAHRAGLPSARFADDLTLFGDWDIFCSLCAEHDPFALPAISVIYRTETADRLSLLTPQHLHDMETVRARNRQRLARQESQGRE